MAVTNEKTQIVGIKKDKEKLCSLTHSSLSKVEYSYAIVDAYDEHR